MSSPSKIPVFAKKSNQKQSKNLKQNKAGEKKPNNTSQKQNNISQKPKKKHKPAKSNKVDVPQSGDKNAAQSSTAEKDVENRNVQKQKNVADRRGISEIKRSEQNLRNLVEELEKEMKDIKLEIDEMENIAKSNELAQSSLQDIAGNLEKENNKLTQENASLCGLIEEKQINPVTKDALPVSESLKEVLQSRISEGAGEAENIVGTMHSLNQLCDDTKNRLISVDCKPTDK